MTISLLEENLVEEYLRKNLKYNGQYKINNNAIDIASSIHIQNNLEYPNENHLHFKFGNVHNIKIEHRGLLETVNFPNKCTEMILKNCESLRDEVKIATNVEYLLYLIGCYNITSLIVNASKFRISSNFINVTLDEIFNRRLKHNRLAKLEINSQHILELVVKKCINFTDFNNIITKTDTIYNCDIIDCGFTSLQNFKWKITNNLSLDLPCLTNFEYIDKIKVQNMLCVNISYNVNCLINLMLNDCKNIVTEYSKNEYDIFYDISNILNDFLKLKNRKEYIMDTSLALLDKSNGCDDYYLAAQI